MPHRILATFALILLLTGCTAAGYQPNGIGGGYAETRLTDDSWRLSYWAADPTNRETLQTYWLYRAAELTLAKGYRGFEVISPVLGGDPGSPGFPPYQIAAGPIFIPVMVPPHPPPVRMEGEIHLLHPPFQPRRLKVFDAARLQAALYPHVFGRKCDEGNVCSHYHAYLYAP